MSASWYINSLLIIVGVAALIYSIFTASRIIRELASGILRGRWILLRFLVGLFILGYLIYWIFLPHDAQLETLIVSFVFFLGAVFVLAVNWLMLQTTRDIKRVATLELQSITDPLLGIYNRRYLDHRLGDEIKRAERYKFNLSLLLLDIDHFKQVNDKFGHLVGDKVLINIGKILKDNTRQSDIVARYGGEELAVILPITDEDPAFKLAERLRVILEKIPYTSGKSNTEAFYCTVSIGVASLTEEPCSPTDLLHKADIALYQAKKTGRNRVVAYNVEYTES